MDRSKFKSLTLINWNGFYARKFDLDSLVTTLSGGNGAGKSTTMAAFVTALIPDLQLLHFRNTTESGSTSASRDRGLHGKIKEGNCYSLLECENSEKTNVLFGVKLQQVAGRDKKVELKLFSVHGYSEDTKIFDIFTNKVGENKVQILNLPEIKADLEKGQKGIIKTYNSIIEYHNAMFDYGLLPRKLSTSSDRNKYYKLIEASLYGGISSSITKSLREYLLPDNQGIKKSFEEFEHAVRENRMTINALNQTQHDRDFFKQLVNHSIEYVASDYMLQQQSRLEIIQKALDVRKDLYKVQTCYLNTYDFVNEYNKTLEDNKATQHKLIRDFQAATEYYTIANSAVIDQERLEEELAKSSQIEDNIAEQNEVYEQILATEEDLKEQLHAIEIEQEEIREQQADLQTALDREQTRQVQAKQAQAKLKELETRLDKKVHLDELDSLQQSYKLHSSKLQNQVHSLKSQLNLGASHIANFNKQLTILNKISPDTDPDQAFNIATNIIDDFKLKQQLTNQESSLSQQLHRIQQSQQSNQQQVQRQQAIINQLGMNFESREQLMEFTQDISIELESIKNQLATENDLLNQEQRTLSELISKQASMQRLTIKYGHSQEKYSLFANKIDNFTAEDIKANKSENGYYDVTSLRKIMSDLYKVEATQNSRLSQLEQLIDDHQNQLHKLNQASLNSGSNLSHIAQQLGGEVLSEIYDDISINDSAYYSALYGPERDAIIVQSLADITDKLAVLQDCPNDLYIIESEFANFDESMFESEELGEGVLVKVSDKQWRYSKLDQNSSFGKAAREIKIAELETQLEQYKQEDSELNFQHSSVNRLIEQIGNFLKEFVDIDLSQDPSIQTREINLQVNQLKAKLNNANRNKSTLEDLESQLETKINLSTRLYDIFVDPSHSSDQSLDQVQELKDQLTQIRTAKEYIQQYASLINQLDLKTLSNPPVQNQDDDGKHRLIQLEEELKNHSELSSLLDELVERKNFLTIELVGMQVNQTGLQASLKDRIQDLNNQRQMLKDRIQEYDQKNKDCYRILTSLDVNLTNCKNSITSLRTKLENVVDYIDQQAIEQALLKRNKLKAELDAYNEYLKQQEIKFNLEQNNLEQITLKLTSLNREYNKFRADVVYAKSSFNRVLSIIKQNNLNTRLNKPEFLQLPTAELRSKSDRALGMLRNIIGDNEYLRDNLRASEDLSQPELKIAFFLSVFDHLRERIRQDVITTDDPIEAIDLMEIEINKLTKLMKQREKDIAISTVHVADILSKTIQREEVRIQGLNQGLQHINFGQVKSVRLTINLRETHALVLTTLREAHEKHADIFNNSSITFTQALGMLYQKLNSSLNWDNANIQSIGESLLDYRNYIELGVEVYRGADGWLKAESGALSTGEAIGTGMSILLMVIQTWEVESKSRRASTIAPCRLLFLDEAARLDGKSIETLFELCNRLEMQLVIAAPENISPENGTTYRLSRKIHNNSEYVHVVGLRGFGKNIENKLETK